MNYSKKIPNLIKKNPFLSFFALCVLVVVIIATMKILSPNTKDVYVKAKVSQGLWWATTAQPNLWYVKGIDKGLVQKDLRGKAIAEIVDVRSYPGLNSNEFNVYIIVRVAADYNGRTGSYKFARTNLAIASPVLFEFPSVSVNATVMDISSTPFKDTYVEKTIMFEKRWAPNWEFDAIQIGSTYFDGHEVVLEILDKQKTDVYAQYDGAGNNYPVESQPGVHIQVKARIRLRKSASNLLFGEEQLTYVGKRFYASTDQFRFEDYKIVDIR